MAWLGPDGASLRRRARSVIALGAIAWGIIASTPVPAGSARGITKIVLVSVCVIGWLSWVFQPEWRPAAARADDPAGPVRSANGGGLAASFDGVGRVASIDGVGRVASIDGVGLATSVDGVGTAASADGRGLAAPDDGVGLATSVDGVGTAASADDVGLAASTEQVRPAASLDGVRPTQSADGSGPGNSPHAVEPDRPTFADRRFGWPPTGNGAGTTPLAIAGLVVTGLAATALSIVVPHSPAVAFIAVAVVRASHWWRPWWSAAFAVGLALAYTVGHLAIGDAIPWLVAGPAAILTALLLGLVRRQNDELAADAIAVREERARFSALDERTRIAREIHDVLAHSLAALSVQLETADALLESGRTDQGHESVRRAGQLAREGIAETRRAIGALRGDTLPLPELLDALVAGYRDDLGARAGVEVDGAPRGLRADVSLTLYRTAQEAVTNVRKHAPGAEVDVRLDYRPDAVALSVTNGAGVRETPLAGAGGGYGLIGLRERAELAGGTFRAAPAGPGWRVDVRIPT